jgi:hypothetical protein
VHVPGLAPAVKGPLDVDAVLTHRNRMSADWKDEGQVEWIKSAGIDLLRGHGRLTGEREVSVETPEGETVHLRARHAVAVCTGSRAALPPLPGIENVRQRVAGMASSDGAPMGVATPVSGTSHVPVTDCVARGAYLRPAADHRPRDTWRCQPELPDAPGFTRVYMTERCCL